MYFKIIKPYITLAIVFFSFASTVHAGFEITEIMYDLDGTDTNREWVEVKNTGSDAADLSKWYIFSDNTKHALAPQGESMVQAGAYAVISQNATNFRTDWPNFSGLLFDSSWTGFSNDGESIGLKDPDLNLVSPISFTPSQGGAGNGDSLQNVNGSWTGATPTPGAENQGGGSGGGGTGGGGTGGGSGGGSSPSTSGTTTQVVKKKEIEAARITTNIIANNTVFAGIPFSITNTTLGKIKEPIKMGWFVWNFGDGQTRSEYVHKPFEYVYQYPGEYVMTLSFYSVNQSIPPDATDRLTIKVLPSQIYISSVGKSGDSFIELENKSSAEVDLSRFVLNGSIHTFYIPQGTIILPNQKLVFSGRVTRFTNDDVSFVNLQDPNGESAAVYPSRKSSTNYYKNNTSLPSPSNIPSPSSAINLNDLGASANNTREIKISTSMLAWLGLVGVIILGLLTVLLIRRRSNSDYVEKDIRASDMTIIE